MKLKLPKVVIAMLERRGAAVDTGLRASRAQLIKTCKEYGYPSYDPVMVFETAFGGLQIPEDRKISKNEPCWYFGAHACITAGGHADAGKKQKLVPVVTSPNDVIYYLDKQGRGYAEDTIEDIQAVRFAGDGTSLVCRIVLEDALFSRRETSLDLPGLQGDRLAKELSLKLVAEASDKDRRFFTDKTGELLVAEDVKRKRTRFAAAAKKQLKLVKVPPPAGTDRATKEMLPLLGKESIRMVSENRVVIPDYFEHLPDLRDLDISINKLETLPESLWRATQLTRLDLSFNPLKVLPDGIGNLTSLRSLLLRRCPLTELPAALAGAKNLTNLVITECESLDVDAALAVIAKLSKLKELSLPLSRSLTSLAPLAGLPLKSLYLNGTYVRHPDRLPGGLGQLKKLADLRIEYADDIAQLPEAPEDIRPLRLIFADHFSDEDIRASARKQPAKLYMQAFAATLS